MEAFDYVWRSGPVEDGVSDGQGHFGVHVKYEDLYKGFAFLALVWITGQLASKLLHMPALVGEIMMGIALGPSALHIVPYPEGWVLFGEIGLVLMVLEAGFDVDYPTLKLIGVRGAIIATVGTILPITIGFIIGEILEVGDPKQTFAAAATFGPTSVGIALNVLKSGQVLNTPIGQLVVSAAVIDDMIALLVLTQLQGMKGGGDLSFQGLIIPVFSALSFLLIGGAIALFVLPPFLNGFVLNRFRMEDRGKIEIMIMFAILLAMMPATYYGRASYLMGAFISGLGFCSFEELHHEFTHQFKPCLQWLVRIFFAASIGFQVPIQDFFKWKVVWQGSLYCLTWLIGKNLVGLLTPNISGEKRFFKTLHRRDCFIVGNSMAAEGEFAFVIAVYSVSNGLIPVDLYASLIFSVLMSTIVPPFLLRFTISHYKNLTAESLRQIAEQNAQIEKMSSQERRERELADAIYLCVQTQSVARWGLLWELMSTMAELGLDIIDHRVVIINSERHDLLATEAYVCMRPAEKDQESMIPLETHIEKIKDALTKTINNEEDCLVEVQQWFPGVMEQADAEGGTGLTDKLMREAAKKLSERNLMVAKRDEEAIDWSSRTQGVSTLKGYIRDAPNDAQ